MGTARVHVRMEAPADAVWAMVRDTAAIAAWFPGMTASAVDGTTRTITLATGLTLAEEITLCHDGLRRLTYRITGGLPILRDHRASVDVIDLDDGAVLAVYTTEIEPHALAPVFAGATHAALEQLRTIVEAR